MAVALFCRTAFRLCIPPGAVFLFVLLLSVWTWHDADAENLARLPSNFLIPSESRDWDCLRNGFVLTEHYHGAQVSHFIRSFGSRYFQQKTKQILKYQGFLNAEVLRRQHLPAELALLPLIESALHPDARSNARAVGIWQFMAGTAREHGLVVNQQYDGRKDILASTHAALNYLESLHRNLGHWLLAVAAYNAGEGTVRRALKKAGKHRSLDFWSLDLPTETRNHVAQWLALSSVVLNPDKYNTLLPELPVSGFLLYRLETSAKGQNAQSFDWLASRIGIDKHRLQQFNPGFHQGHYIPEFQRALLVPASSQSMIRMAAGNCTGWQESYTVKSGDRLIRIARAHQVKTDLLMTCNRLYSDRIQIGQRLKVPVSKAI